MFMEAVDCFVLRRIVLVSAFSVWFSSFIGCYLLLLVLDWLFAIALLLFRIVLYQIFPWLFISLSSFGSSISAYGLSYCSCSGVLLTLFRFRTGLNSHVPSLHFSIFSRLYMHIDLHNIVGVWTRRLYAFSRFMKEGFELGESEEKGLYLRGLAFVLNPCWSLLLNTSCMYQGCPSGFIRQSFFWLCRKERFRDVWCCFLGLLLCLLWFFLRLVG